MMYGTARNMEKWGCSEYGRDVITWNESEIDKLKVGQNSKKD